MSMFPQTGTWADSMVRDDARRRHLTRFFNAVYAWMFVGLAVTAGVGLATSHSPAMMKFLIGNPFAFVGIALGAFVISMAVNRVAMQISAAAGTALFVLYAALIGVMTSAIFLVYPVNTLAAAFLVTGGTFGAMSIYGMVTKTDLTRIGGMLVMAAIGLFIASLVNVFMASNALSWLITYAVVIVFVGLTAYYTQQLKVVAERYIDNPTMTSRLSVVGSLMLYVAFLNLFLSILRIMGDRR